MKWFILALTVFAGLSANAIGGGSSTGTLIPDFAALNCGYLGGTAKPSQTDKNKKNCHIDEWTLFHKMDQRGLVKVHPGGMGNPAAVNCKDIGGTLEPVKTPQGESANCVIDEWMLFELIKASPPYSTSPDSNRGQR
jgi:putative hemolysin